MFIDQKLRSSFRVIYETYLSDLRVSCTQYSRFIFPFTFLLLQYRALIAIDNTLDKTDDFMSAI